jgi:hypothetical protein
MKVGTMKIFKAMVVSADGPLYQIDVIEHDKKLWLVPQWLDSPAEGVSRPARIIRMDTLPHQKNLPGSPYGDYVLNEPVPTELLNLQTPKQPIDGFEFQEMPELSVPLSNRRQN